MHGTRENQSMEMASMDAKTCDRWKFEIAETRAKIIVSTDKKKQERLEKSAQRYEALLDEWNGMTMAHLANADYHARLREKY
jgi:hypothetical protein